MNAKEAYEASMRILEERNNEDLNRAHARIVEAVDQGLTEACLHGKVRPSTLEELKKSGYRISGPGDTDTGSVYVRWAHIADETLRFADEPAAEPDPLHRSRDRFALFGGSTGMDAEPEDAPEAYADLYLVMRKVYRAGAHVSASYWKGGVHWATKTDEFGILVMTREVAEGVCAYMCNTTAQTPLQTAKYEPVAEPAIR